ncbi:Fic family protein [Ornithinimicrobium cryptoxanthini]|uniref:Fic family protein n=1 Tax=Ornithinimicrobium cryptoxanthini TaxID=2934161 RepID=A0ABY4YHN6_9MICO|nr:Fic family protein [Ornithinimicrobium cryptoxanthini]USQ75672.1 Fic family protein [Ornithinimicrobium cryptoxanthini]
MVDLSWPAVSQEPRAWAPTHGAVGLTRRERLAASQTSYDAAVVAEIAVLTPALPADVTAEAEDAVAELARFDESMGRDVLPYSAVLLRGESIASSDIEHITSSARNISLAEVTRDESTGYASLVAANVRAMRRAIDVAIAPDVAGVLTLHEELMRHDPRHEAGAFRAEQVWIGGHDSTPVGAHFIPPHHERIAAAMDDLARFARRTDLSRMAQLALTHAQFATIHPFTDGNGRTGRALMHVMLRESGLVQHGVVPVSAGLLTDTRGYHEALDAYRDGDPEPIVRLFTASSLKAVTNASRLVTEVREIRQSWDARVRARKGSTTWRIADLLLRYPLVTARTLHDHLGTSPTNAPRAIAPLLEAGVVRSGRHYASRSAYWWSPEITDAVDDFAVRAGRRHL